MSCVKDAAKELFKQAGVPFPRSSKFENLARLVIQDGPHAERQARILCCFLRKLESDIEKKQNIVEKPGQFSFVFIHPNDKAHGRHAASHCLGLLRWNYCIKRYCSYEANWRSVHDGDTFNDFRFTRRDWTTSIPDRFVANPFKFSYFITSEGYSTWITPKKVLNNIKKGVSFNHQFSYDKEWDEISTPKPKSSNQTLWNSNFSTWIRT